MLGELLQKIALILILKNVEKPVALFKARPLSYMVMLESFCIKDQSTRQLQTQV